MQTFFRIETFQDKVYFRHLFVAVANLVSECQFESLPVRACFVIESLQDEVLFRHPFVAVANLVSECQFGSLPASLLRRDLQGQGKFRHLFVAVANLVSDCQFGSLPIESFFVVETLQDEVLFGHPFVAVANLVSECQFGSLPASLLRWDLPVQGLFGHPFVAVASLVSECQFGSLPASGRSTTLGPLVLPDLSSKCSPAWSEALEDCLQRQGPPEQGPDGLKVSLALPRRRRQRDVGVSAWEIAHVRLQVRRYGLRVLSGLFLRVLPGLAQGAWSSSAWLGCFPPHRGVETLVVKDVNVADDVFLLIGEWRRRTW